MNSVPLWTNSISRNCWTDVLAGTTTTSIPGATATYHDPSATTTTYIWYEFDKRRAELEDRDLTVVEVNQCTETDTAYVISTVRETVATLTSTITEYASTATVTFTSSCPGYDCFFDN